MVLLIAAALIGAGAVAIEEKRKKKKLAKMSPKEREQIERYQIAQRFDRANRGRNYIPPERVHQLQQQQQQQKQQQQQQQHHHQEAPPYTAQQPSRSRGSQKRANNSAGASSSSQRSGTYGYNVPSTPMKPSTFRPATQRASMPQGRSQHQHQQQSQSQQQHTGLSSSSRPVHRSSRPPVVRPMVEDDPPPAYTP
ncbi:hypothetical protein PVL30_002975 [Lodderomyces elongisporus]|uniref:uncharacterized protein n=1 Tax=Lodderomyces elongisporus TaxID=36914 RepID=UPI002922AA65|nr:uncharacterized protein PVL30_002975 [Lodderomyces elongisporus]WLF79223.1 hypothetical protein PVL30_002975 [Lodderomyces elongisporus]